MRSVDEGAGSDVGSLDPFWIHGSRLGPPGSRVDFLLCSTTGSVAEVGTCVWDVGFAGGVALSDTG